MQINLRTAILDELSVIHAIRRDAILGIPSESDGSEHQAWADLRSPGYYAERVAAGQLIIAYAGGDDMGWGSSAGEWITGLYVRSSSSGRGAGRVLMSRLETEIMQRGHPCVRLASSPNALGFYVRLGYVVLGDPDSDGAIPMQKCL